jgi:sugar phosphate isomerase/epimerase
MPSHLAVQMYTVRDYTRTGPDLAAALAKIRAIGYEAVQLSAVGAMNGAAPEVDAARARKMLDDCGLRCIATHCSWSDLRDRTDAEIELHRMLGCDFTAIGGIPPEYGEQGANGFRRFVEDAGPVIAALRAAGIRFGYHNHAFEFMRAGAGRETLYDLLVDAGNPDLLLELDVYWADHAGVNPVRLFERCPGRMPVIHLKDKEISPEGRPGMAPIGEGNLDWEGIIPACRQAGVEWYAVEQDECRRDPFDCLRSSFEYLSGFGL